MPETIEYLLSADRLDFLLSRIAKIHVAVLGDFFLDKYLVIDPGLSESSIETGLRAHQIVEIRCSPGAAGTVTNNLAALGAGKITALGVFGDDGQGYELLQGLHATGVITDRLIRTVDRFTPTYTKPMVREPGGEREMERLDIKNRSPMAGEIEERLSLEIRALLESRDAPQALVVLDQVQERNCGVVTDSIRRDLAVLAIEHPAIHFFADSRERIGEFAEMTIKPNLYEAAKAVGIELKENVSMPGGMNVGLKLANRNSKEVFLTMGAEGIIVCDATGAHIVRAVPVTGPIDIVGAGDSATAGIVCALCAGATPTEAAAMGNLCAAVTIRKLGTTGTASIEEIRETYARL